MKDFFNWAFDVRRPMFIPVFFFFLGAFFTIVYFIVALTYGNITMIVAPFIVTTYFIWEAYKKDTKR